jgi:hypothetical protein
MTILVLFVTRMVSAHCIGWVLLVLPEATLKFTINSYLLKQKESVRQADRVHLTQCREFTTPVCFPCACFE